MINAIFEGDPNAGLYLLPLLVWYPLQLILGSLLSREIQAFSASEKLRLLIEKDRRRDEAGSEDAVRTEAYLSGTLSIESGSLASIESDYYSDEDDESKSYRPGLRRQSVSIFHHDELPDDVSFGGMSLGDESEEGFHQFTLVCYESIVGNTYDDEYDDDDDDDEEGGVGGLHEEMGGEIIEEALNDMDEHEELVFEEPLKDEGAGGSNRDSLYSHMTTGATDSGRQGQAYDSFFSVDSQPGKKGSLTPSPKSSLTPPPTKSSLKKPSSMTSQSSQSVKKPSSSGSLVPKKPASSGSLKPASSTSLSPKKPSSLRSKASLTPSVKSKASLTPSLKSKASLTPSVKSKASSVKSKESLTPSEKSELRRRRRAERRSRRGSTAIANIMGGGRRSSAFGFGAARSRRGSTFSRSRRGSTFGQSRRVSTFGQSRRGSTFGASGRHRASIAAPCGRSHNFYKLGSVYEKQSEPGADFLMGTFCAGDCNQPIANHESEVGKLPSEAHPVYYCIRCKTHCICDSCWKQKNAPKIEDSIWNLY